MQNVHHFTHYDKLGSALKELLTNNSDDNYLLLFKGSQNTIFLEEAIKYILQDPIDEERLTRQ